MKTKFTPGPWTYEMMDDEKHLIRTKDYPQRTIAIVKDDVVGHRNTENAALLAAAPEMYEALELIKGFLPDCDGGPLRTMENIIDEAMAKARMGNWSDDIQY
jgi:hypothetical protein